MTPIVCAQPGRALSPAAPVQPYIRTARGRPASRRILPPSGCLPRVTFWRAAVIAMPRATPSKWRPRGIELFRVQALYSSGDRMKLLDHLGASSATPKFRNRLLNRSLNAAAVLRGELHFGRKPTLQQLNASIAPLVTAAFATAEALGGLDYQSRKLIERPADEDLVANEREDDSEQRYRLPIMIGGEMTWCETSLGPDRLSLAMRAIDDLQRWATAAPTLELSQASARTARKQAIRSAIDRLKSVWGEAWKGRNHADPKLREFLPFVQAVLNPVLEEDGSPDDLRRATEDVLHGAGTMLSIGEEQGLYRSGGNP